MLKCGDVSSTVLSDHMMPLNYNGVKYYIYSTWGTTIWLREEII